MQLHSSSKKTESYSPTENSKVEVTTKQPFFHEIKKRSTTDDLDLMLMHEEFPKLLALSAQVKELRSTLVNAPASKRVVSSALSPAEIHAVVERMQQQLLRYPQQCCKSVRRGEYPMTDYTIDDSIITLQREHDYLKQWDLIASPKKKGSRFLKGKEANTNKDRKNKDAIAVKYAKWQCDILHKWMIDHIDQPFPDQVAIQELMTATGLNESQVVNWTTNVRKRNRKATLDGKKPHHFIDFLFLVHDRETRRETQTKTIPNAFCDGETQSETLHNRDFSPLCMQSTQMCPNGWPLNRDQGLRSLHYYNEMHQVNEAPMHIGDNSDHPDVNKNGDRLVYESNYSGILDSSHQATQQRDVEDLMQPLPWDVELMNEKLNPILDNFAELWLCSSTANASRGETVPLLPVVTEDSSDTFYDSSSSPKNDLAENDCNPPDLLVHDRSSVKHERQPSFSYDELEGEDIRSWAAELGLTLDLDALPEDFSNPVSFE